MRRRTILLGALAATAAGTAAAQTTDIGGTVTFEGGARIPEGTLVIYPSDPVDPDVETQGHATARIRSDGKVEAIDFSLPLHARFKASPTLQVVASLEREDGWLLARGSAQVAEGSPLQVILNVALY